MKAIRKFAVGSSAKLTVTLTHEGVPSDTTLLELIVKNPAGTVTTYTLKDIAVLRRLDVGVYVAHVLFEMAGMYRVRWQAPQPYTGAVETSIEVLPSLIPNNVTTY